MPRDVKSRRLRRVLPLWVLTGVLTSTLAWRAITTSEQSAIVNQFHASAGERAVVFRVSLRRDVQVARSVAALFEASRRVERREFEHFARPVLADHPAIEQVAWARQRHCDETGTSELIVEYLSGDGGPPLRIGSDLFADPAVRRRIGGELAIPETLVVRWKTPDEEYSDGAPRLLVLSALHDHATAGLHRPRQTGVIALTVRLDRVYENALKSVAPRGLQFYLYEEAAARGEDLVYFHPSLVTDIPREPLLSDALRAQPVQYRSSVALGGLELDFAIVPAAGTLAKHHTSARWVVLLSGLAVTCIGAWHLVIVEDRRRRLKELLARYRAVNDTSSNAIVLLDASLRVLDWNPVAERLFGCSREEAVGRSYAHGFIAPDDRQKIAPEIWRVLTEGKQYAYEGTCVAPSGGERRVGWTASRLPGAGGAVLGVVLVGEDVTDRRTAEEAAARLQSQLFQSQKMEAIGVLAGGIAHDFNNVLAAMIGYTELALGKISSDARACRDLEQVLDAGYHAARLVKQILAFGRVSKSVTVPIDIRDAVARAVDLVASSVPAMIRVHTRFDPAAGVVIADETEIQQIVMNLCTNAYQAIGDTEGAIEVSLERVSVDSDDEGRLGLARGSYVRIRVSDTGCGMSDATRERIFEPFFTTKPVGEGSGMGLAVVHGIVMKSGGNVHVESVEGRGTVIEVYLPRVEQRAVTEDTAHSSVGTGSEHVLLVDDEKRLADMGRQMLEALGYRVTVAYGSLEAIERFRHEPAAFDVVITDQAMPDMSGVELAREMMSMRPDLPIVLATGFSKVVTAENARSLGLRGYVSKPFLLQDLGRAVRAALRREEEGEEDTWHAS